MKQLAISIATLAMASSAFGSACYQGATLSSYEAAGSCTFAANGNSYTLQDFTFLAVSVLTEGAGAGDFTVTESSGANGPIVTITPDGSLAISTHLLATETFLFGFDITSNNDSIGFSDVSLSEQSALSGLIGTSGTIAEEDCFGGALPLPGDVNIASLGSGGLACLGGGVSVGASIGLTPGVNANATVGIPINGPFTNSVDVLKEINLTAVGALLTDATASVADISQGFTTVGAPTPEPGTFYMLLGGCGLIGISLAQRKRGRR